MIYPSTLTISDPSVYYLSKGYRLVSRTNSSAVLTGLFTSNAKFGGFGILLAILAFIGLFVGFMFNFLFIPLGVILFAVYFLYMSSNSKVFINLANNGKITEKGNIMKK